jgi:hypothetical protein
MKNENLDPENIDSLLLPEETEYEFNKKLAKKMSSKNIKKLQLDMNKELKSKNERLNILDRVIEDLNFSTYHLATIMVCIFSMTCDGYLNLHLRYSDSLFTSRYNWTRSDINKLLAAQNLFGALGALISQNARTSHWDVSSNALISILGFLCTIMIIFYTDPVIYAILIVLFSVCHGFIINICTNYLLELLRVKYRSFFFLFSMSFRFIGMSLCGLVIWYLRGIYGVDDPSVLIIGLSATQLILAFSLLYLIDSPRVLFYNSESVNFYDLIQDITNDGEDRIFNRSFKNELMGKIENVRRIIDSIYGHQGNEGLFGTYYYLWVKPHLKITLKAIIFIFISGSFLSNVVDSHLYLMNFYSRQDPKITIGNPDFIFNYKNYSIALFYFVQFLIFNCLAMVYFLLCKKRLYITLPSLSICLLAIILIMSTRSQINVFVALFESFGFFYYAMVYLHFSEYTTTKLRNCITSFMFLSSAIVNIFQSFFIESLSGINPDYTLGVNIGIIFVLVLLEIFWIHLSIPFQTKDRGIQEIELNIMSEKYNKSDKPEE